MKNYTALLLLVIPFLTFADPFFSDEFKDITLKGSVDCGKWLDARRSNASMMLEQTVVGYFNGLAMGTNFDVWMKPKKISASQLFYMVDNDCKKSPSWDVYDSLNILFLKRQGN